MKQDDASDNMPEGGPDRVEHDPALTVGATVRRLRESRGWSLQRLATAAHLSKQHLWDIERGEARPHELVIKYLARALGTRVSDLMGETDPDQAAQSVSPSLRDFAQQRGLGPAQVEALAKLNYRGRAPSSIAEWEMIWRLLRAVLDDDAAGGSSPAGDSTLPGHGQGRVGGPSTPTSDESTR